MKKIKEARIKKGISQTAMANEIGLSQPGYANIENGETKNIPLLVAVKISKVLGIGFNELYDIDGDSQKIDDLNKEIETLKKRVVELDEQLNDKRQIIEFLTQNDLIVTTARKLSKQDGVVWYDSEDMDTLIKGMEEQESFDRNALEYVQDYIKRLKGS